MPPRYHQPPLLKFCRGRGRMPINNNDHWWKTWGGGADMIKPSTAQREDRSLRGPQSQASYTVHTAAVVVVALVLAVVPAGQALAATWSVTATPDPPSSWGSRLTGVDASSADDAWAVGYAEYGSAPTARPITARWDGSGWVLVPTPVPSAGGRLEGIDADPRPSHVARLRAARCRGRLCQRRLGGRRRVQLATVQPGAGHPALERAGVAARGGPEPG